MMRGVVCGVLGALALGCSDQVDLERLGQSSGALTFELPSASPAASTTLAEMVVADMNGDSRDDVIAGGWNAAVSLASLEVFLGGPGGLGTPTTSPLGVGSEIVGLQVVDLNGDLVLDVLVNDAAGRVWPVFGNGDGTFAPAAPLPLDEVVPLVDVRVSDVNGDGLLDLLGVGSISVLNPAYPHPNTCGTPPKLTCCFCGPLPPPYVPSPVLVIVPGSGGGAFAGLITYPSNVLGSSGRLTLGDWDRDGSQDVALTWTEPIDPTVSTFAINRLGLMSGNGSGTFSPVSSVFGPVGSPLVLFSEDLTDDGLVDIALGFSAFPSGHAGVRVFQGDGQGSFNERVAQVETGGRYPTKAGRADVNGDGRTDVVMADDGGSLHVLQGNGDGSFVNIGRHDTGVVSPAIVTGVASAGLFGDGGDEVLLTTTSSPIVSVIESKGGRLLLPHAAPHFVQGAKTIQIAHFDQDALADLLISIVGTAPITIPDVEEEPPPSAPELRVLPGLGGGAFGDAVVTGGPALAGADLALGDFNVDGHVDVAASMAASVELWLGAGNRTFTRGAQATIDRAPSGSPPLVVGDFNRDTTADVVTAYQRQSDSRAVASLFPGNGLGGWGAPSHVVLDLEVGMVPLEVVAADLTLDGSLDLAVSLFNGATRGAVAVLAGNGAGAFGTPLVLEAGSEARGLALADLNSDGFQDLVVGKANGASGGLRIWWGDGVGGWTAPSDVPVAPAVPPTLPAPPPGSAAPATIIPADFDANGSVDLVLAQAQASLVPQVLSGLGAGAFAPPLALPVLGEVVAVGDLDGDRRPDIVSASGLRTSSLSFVMNSDLNLNTACPAPPCFSITVEPVDLTRGTTPVSIFFNALIQEGLTGVQSNGYGPLPPFGFQLGSPPEYFEIFTTALFAGPVDICIDYNPTSYLNPADVLLFHYDNGVWENVTISNSGTGLVCGRTFSFSPFALVEPIPPTEIVLQASGDAVIHRSEPNLNGGANATLGVARDSRVLIGFDLGAIDPSRVRSARLVVSVGDVDAAGRGALVDAHPVKQTWVEGNGVNARGDQVGNGEGVTWSCARDTNLRNRRPDCRAGWHGGDYDAATAPAVSHGRLTRGEVSWDVTSDVVAGRREGWLLKLRREQDLARIYFGSRASGNSPRLELELTR